MGSHARFTRPLRDTSPVGGARVRRVERSRPRRLGRGRGRLHPGDHWPDLPRGRRGRGDGPLQHRRLPPGGVHLGAGRGLRLRADPDGDAHRPLRPTPDAGDRRPADGDRTGSARGDIVLPGGDHRAGNRRNGGRHRLPVGDADPARLDPDAQDPGVHPAHRRVGLCRTVHVGGALHPAAALTGLDGRLRRPGWFRRARRHPGLAGSRRHPGPHPGRTDRPDRHDRCSSSQAEYRDDPVGGGAAPGLLDRVLRPLHADESDRVHSALGKAVDDPGHGPVRGAGFYRAGAQYGRERGGGAVRRDHLRQGRTQPLAGHPGGDRPGRGQLGGFLPAGRPTWLRRDPRAEHHPARTRSGGELRLRHRPRRSGPPVHRHGHRPVEHGWIPGGDGGLTARRPGAGLLGRRRHLHLG